MVKKFIKDESGATAIEYGLIAALVSVGIIAGLSVLSEDKIAPANSKIYIANQSEQTIQYVFGHKKNPKSPVRLTGHFNMAPGENKWVDVSAKSWVFFHSKEAPKILRVSVSNVPQINKEFDELNKNSNLSWVMCITQNKMDDVLISTACREEDASLADFYLANPGSEFYILQPKS